MVERREFLRICATGVAGSVWQSLDGRGRCEELKNGVLYPRRLPAAAGKFSWYDAVLAEIPKLKHDRGKRWPLIAWEGFFKDPHESQPPEKYRELLARGLTQHVRLDPRLIETALALQKAGCPVIVMEGSSGTFPASLTGDPPTWAHQFVSGYKPKDPVKPCPSLHAGWAILAARLRETLKQFRDRGVTIDAVWADWENDPLYGGDRFDQAKHCRRCRELLPKKVLASQNLFFDYTARKFYELFGAYYAAPILEFYPKCSVTNWLAQPSTPENPQLGWSGDPGRIHMPPLVTAWNPTAYGAASWLWNPRTSPAERRDQEHVDQVYTNLLLRQVSLTEKLSARWAPEKESIPWIARWISEPPEIDFPVMSRERYREVLRHMWLRGVDAMQVFSPRMAGFEVMALPEVADAASVYDEMLALREFLDDGRVLNYDVPAEQDAGVLWSGLALKDRAVIRTFKQGGGEATQTVRPWANKGLTLTATSKGETYVIDRQGTVKPFGS